MEFSRVVAFSDGVFAVAATLLALNLQIPDQLSNGQSVADALWDEHGTLFAYALSFAVIGRLWLVHHRFFGEVTHFDRRLISLNLLYLGFVVLIPFTSDVLGAHGDTTAGVVIYAVNLAVTNFLGAAMFLYAARTGLTRERFVSYVDSPTRLRNVAAGAVFAFSIPIAIWNPLLAMLIWGILFLVPSRN